MFQSIKSIFYKTKNSPVKFITIPYNGTSLISLIQQTALQIYGEDHKFYQQYLRPYFDVSNEQLIKDFSGYIGSINDKKYLLSQFQNIVLDDMNSNQCYLCLIKSFWYSYLQNQIKNTYDSTKFLRVQVSLLLEMMLQLLLQVYIETQPRILIRSRKFKIQMIQYLTNSYQFQKVKSLFVHKFKLGCGVNGDFSPSQVQLNVKELDSLINFSQIPAPFHQSIAIMLQFYEQYRLKQKIILLVKVVQKAKQQILQYRQFFSMGMAVIGSDQILPIINFICQKTNKNIFASVQYIRALLGGKKYDDDECGQCLKEVSKDSEYCLTLIQSMASVKCHASKMIA